MRTSGWSIAICARRSMASAGRGTGSMSYASARATASSLTSRVPTPGRYRDWVVDALNRDMPYDEFVRLQLAGDVLRPDDADAIKATGFLVAGAYDTVGQTQQSEAMKRVVRQDELEDIVGTVGQTFLGLTIHCARCHDHKFDPIRQVEYYRLTAALGGVRHGERSLPVGEGSLAQMRQRLAELEKEREAIEQPIRARIRAERKEKPPVAPRPLACWDFTHGLRDSLGGLDANLKGDARLVREGLKVDGRKGYAVSAPLRRDLKAKTLEAWVSLDNLRQRGGGVVSVQTKGGAVFDALVFGEIDAGQWLAGSNNFARTRRLWRPRRDGSESPIGACCHRLERGRHDPRLPRRQAVWEAVQKPRRTGFQGGRGANPLRTAARSGGRQPLAGRGHPSRATVRSGAVGCRDRRHGRQRFRGRGNHRGSFAGRSARSIRATTNRDQ